MYCNTLTGHHYPLITTAAREFAHVRQLQTTGTATTCSLQLTMLWFRLYHNESHRSVRRYGIIPCRRCDALPVRVTDFLAEIEAFQVHFGDRQSPPRCSRPPIPVGVHAGQHPALVSVSLGKPISVKGRAASIHGGSIPSGTHCCLPAIPHQRRPRMMPTALRPPSHASPVMYGGGVDQRPCRWGVGGGAGTA